MTTPHPPSDSTALVTLDTAVLTDEGTGVHHTPTPEDVGYALLIDAQGVTVGQNAAIWREGDTIVVTNLAAPVDTRFFVSPTAEVIWDSPLLGGQRIQLWDLLLPYAEDGDQ